MVQAPPWQASGPRGQRARLAGRSQRGTGLAYAMDAVGVATNTVSSSCHPLAREVLPGRRGAGGAEGAVSRSRAAQRVGARGMSTAGTSEHSRVRARESRRPAPVLELSS